MQFDFNVGPNQSQHIDVVGSFIKYKGGAGTIRVRLNGGGYIDLLPGQGVNNVNFTGVDVQDRTGAQNAGTILAGIYDFRDDRITGTVDVVDGGKARTLAGVAFMGYAYCVPTNGQFSHVQLLNPDGSGRNLHVGQVGFYSSGAVAQGIALAQYSTPLTTLARKGASKRIGGGVSVAEVRTKTDVANLFVGGPMAALAKGLTTLKFLEPIMIPPGFGIVLLNAAAGEDIGGTFEYFEEPA